MAEQDSGKIICDGCNRDRTYTQNSESYRLVLKQEDVPANTNLVTDMVAFPTGIDETKHFCNLTCLNKWLKATGYE